MINKDNNFSLNILKYDASNFGYASNFNYSARIQNKKKTS